jgi:hypothetical protein
MPFKFFEIKMWIICSNQIYLSSICAQEYPRKGYDVLASVLLTEHILQF